VSDLDKRDFIKEEIGITVSSVLFKAIMRDTVDKAILKSMAEIGELATQKSKPAAEKASTAKPAAKKVAKKAPAAKPAAKKA
jgi:hypothetical protein